MSKMSRRLLAMMLLCVFVLTAVTGPAVRVHAQDEEKSLTLTIKPAKETKAGDWLAYVNGAVADNAWTGSMTLPEEWKDGALYTLTADQDGNATITLKGTKDVLESMNIRLIKADGTSPVLLWDNSIARQTLAGTITTPFFNMDDGKWHKDAKTTEAVLLASDVSAAIQAIGTVTLDSNDAISAAEGLYAQLPDAEKAYVTNYTELTKARTDYDTMKALADKKTEAKTKLEEAFAGYSKDNYSEENWKLMEQALADGQKAIEDATDIEKVTEASEAALTALAGIQSLNTGGSTPESGDGTTGESSDETKTEETNTEESKTEESGSEESKTETESVPETESVAATTLPEQTVPVSEANDGIALISGESDVTRTASADNALQTAKNDAKAALLTAKDGYKKADYSDDNWAALESAYNTAVAAIDNAADADAVAAEQKKGTDAMAAIQTMAQAAEASAKAEAETFVDTYLKDANGNIYLTANADNYEKIMSGVTAWNDLTNDGKLAVNAMMTEANGGNKTDYNALWSQAREVKQSVASSSGNTQAGSTQKDVRPVTVQTGDTMIDIRIIVGIMIAAVAVMVVAGVMNKGQKSKNK